MYNILIIISYLLLYILGSILYYKSVKKILIKDKQFDDFNKKIIIVISLLSWLTFIIIFIQRVYLKFNKHE